MEFVTLTERGLYIHPRTGFWRGNVKPDEEWGLGLNETTMAEMLKRNGYATHGIGKWHCGMFTWAHTPAQRGFDSFLGLYLGSQRYFTHRNHYYKGSYDHEEGFIDFRENYYSEVSSLAHFSLFLEPLLI